MRAIQTTYAGCRFRSRLEARWAVFFDRAAITWHYEPQGFVLDDGRRYLPDFHLPLTDTHVEVKGHDGALDDDWSRLLAFACGDGGPSLLIVGQVPDVDPAAVPLHTYLHHGEIRYGIFVGGEEAGVVALAGGPQEWQTTEPEYLPGLRLGLGIADAYRAARAARFEFGQTPSAVGGRR